MTDINTKCCKACNQEKPLSAFYRKTRDDYAHECLECRLAVATNLSKHTPSLMNTDQALLQVSMLNAETSDITFDDVVVEGIREGIQPEVLTRMQYLWDKTELIGGEIIEIGKIIIIKIIEFLKAHPNLTSSLAIGVAVYLLIHAIPFFGPLLAPLLAIASASYAFEENTSLDEAIDMAKEFFQLLVDIFNAVANRWAKA